MKPTTLLLATLWLLLSAPPGAGEESRLDRALAAFTAGEYERTLDLLSEIPGRSGDRPRADYLAGEAQLMLGRPEAAEASFRAVLERKPDAVPAMTGLGRALLARKKAEAAVETMRKAVKIDPTDAQAHRVLGEALDASGRPKEAEKALTRAVKLDGKDPENARALVAHLVARESLAAARKVAKKCAKALPDHPMGWFLLGLVLDREGKDEEAIRAYEKAIEKDDAFLDAHKNLAILCHTVNPLYRDEERTKKALEHYERYFELGGSDPELLELYKQLKSFLASRARGGR